jgi:hypothetical protein
MRRVNLSAAETEHALDGLPGEVEDVYVKWGEQGIHQ